mmetsp:Transcript_132667/g.383593  ORF Transcript_132667/g.383593 Transcript_132667/m.383593 type:complete len:208 (+) Transcript_132667:745-1368(+)
MSTATMCHPNRRRTTSPPDRAARLRRTGRSLSPSRRARLRPPRGRRPQHGAAPPLPGRGPAPRRARGRWTARQHSPGKKLMEPRRPTAATRRARQDSRHPHSTARHLAQPRSAQPAQTPTPPHQHPPPRTTPRRTSGRLGPSPQPCRRIQKRNCKQSVCQHHRSQGHRDCGRRWRRRPPHRCKCRRRHRRRRPRRCAPTHPTPARSW